MAMWLIWKLDLEYRKPNHLHITFVLLDIVLSTSKGSPFPIVHQSPIQINNQDWI